MAGDHACPVCQSRFTRPQHVTRHMRSHTGDRPYNCTQCGDRFARSDLLSRHVNKCHNGTSTSTQRGGRRHTHTASSSVSSTNSVNLAHPNPAETPCDTCLTSRQQCDLGSPCGKCILSKSQCTYTAKARSVASGHARRVSLPSLTQASQQPFNLLGQGPQALGSYSQSSGLGLPPYGLGQYGQSNGVGFAGASTLDRSAVPGSLPPLSGAQPVPMPNGQYVDNYSTYPSMFGNDQQQQSSLNSLGGSLPRLGSLSYAASQQPDSQFTSRPPSLEQAYDFGNSNMLPSLSQGFDGSADPKAAPAAYLQQRRGSLQLPGSQSHQQQPFHYQAQGIDGLGSGQSFHQSPQQPQAQGSPASLSRHFDLARINERLASVRGGYPGAMDDGSSVSDFGSNNSGAPSPVPSAQSISGFSASSRPTSSAGSGGAGRDGAAAPSGETFTSSLQGAIPLPTPLQLGSFNAFQAQHNSMNDRTPGASTDTVAGGGAGGKIFPPYQNFENMNLDEQAASFAAAAKHASNHGTYGGSGTSSSWNPGQNYGALGAPTPSQYPVLSAGGKERAINELKDFWAAFISEPLTGGAGGNGSNGNGNGPSLQKQLSMPSLKTPLPLSSERTSMMDLNHPTPRTLYPSSGHHSMLGMMFKPEPSSLSSSSNNRPPNNNSNIKLDDPSEASQSGGAASAQPPAPVIGDPEAENLRSYQEACLRRETPMLRLQARPKSRLIKSSSLSPQFGGDRKKLPGVDGMVGGESVRMKVDGSNTSSPSKGGSASNVPVFAEPFPPDSKEARDWNHYRAQAAAATDLHQATTTASARPSYKRLPSTTLGPEHSKKSRDEGDADVTGSDAGYHVSYPQPGYNAAANAGGGAHGAWMRQRSMSSPSSMRPHFDWQSFGSQRA